MYRTIDTAGHILETWDTREQVSPTIDYHKIQWLSDTRKTDRVIAEYDSLYEFHNIPF